MKNPFELPIQKKIEDSDGEKVIDILIDEFPEELRDKLEEMIEDMDADAAKDLLIKKLTERNESFVEWSLDKLPADIEVIHEVPLAVLSSIEETMQNEEVSLLGKGKNAGVYESIRRPYACYKVLFTEKAKQYQVKIVREAVLQYRMSQILDSYPKAAQIPEVLGFIDHPDVQAIMMEKIKGYSLYAIIEQKKGVFPKGFDVNVFFTKLESAIAILNEHGYFHGDLNNNAGNVMVDEEGNPWIIDFGSAIRAVDHAGDTQSYKLRVGGTHFLSTDLSGVQTLKQRVLEFLRKEKI